MPELPEVEVIRRGLEPLLVNRRILGFRYSGKYLRDPFPADLMRQWVEGQHLVAVRRRAKYLLIELENGASLVIHLGMTGRMCSFPAATPPHRHDHLALLLDDAMELRFNDTRRFGSVRVLRPGEQNVFFGAMGVEPLDEDFSAAYLRKRAASRHAPVKNFLMDGRIVAGIGNIYASEILFCAGIRPEMPAGELSPRQWRAVVKATGEVLRRAIACGGTTISDFVGSNGEAGYFQQELQVYGRSGEACRKCGATVARTVMAGRATYFCPRCQR